MSDFLPFTHPQIAALPVHDRGEPLVDVRAVPALRTDERTKLPVLLRTTVVDRLVVAQSLLPRGLRLLVVEGYRSPARQQLHFHRCREDLRSGHPSWPEERLDEEANRYCSPLASAPHPTGGAVDLTLCTSRGAELAMGSPVNAGPVQSAGVCVTDAPAVIGEVRANRATLGAVMSGAGLVNLPTAWWHWSYGDNYWCHCTGAAAAPYGTIER